MSRPPPSPTPSDALRTAAPELARQVGLVLGGLCTAIVKGTAGQTLLRALIDLAWMRVNRTRHRLERLLARVAAGWLPRPAASRTAPAEPRDPTVPRRTRVCAPALGRLPRARAWLVRVAGYHAAGSGSQLEHLLTDPAMAEFLAAVPSAARMLRPLCRTLGISPPVLGFKPPKPPPVKRVGRKSAAHSATFAAPSAIAQVYAALRALPAPEPAPDPYHFVTSVLVR
jgi:hypothetical protein